jgi:hypothetical protein
MNDYYNLVVKLLKANKDTDKKLLPHKLVYFIHFEP